MAYSFLDDIEKIRHFSKSADNYFVVIPKIIEPLLGHHPQLQSSVAAALNQDTPSFRLILRKTVPLMLCIAWEGFVEQLKITEVNRYGTNFISPYELYFNEDIREIFLLRNCITHSMGKIDAQYLGMTVIKTFTTLGEQVDFTEVQLDTQFKLFGDAFTKITI